MKVNDPRPPRAHRKVATSTPTFYHSPDHCPEAGLGGTNVMVSYRGETIGHVYSTWDRRGVHFEIRDAQYRTITDADGVPRAYETREAAVVELLDLWGIDLEEPLGYDKHKGPRGGGEDFEDRRY